MAASRGWIFSPRTDVVIFVGPLLVGFLLVLTSKAFSNSPEEAFHPALFLIYGLCLDTPHTYSTLFRAHFENGAWKSSIFEYLAIPLAIYSGLLGLYWMAPAVMWTLILYGAAWHFIRQQIGWINWTAHKAGESKGLRRTLDHSAIYVMTLFPLLVWHSSLIEASWFANRPFPKLIPIDYIPPMEFAYWTLILFYIALQIRWVLKKHEINFAKYLVVLTTWATWYLGIVVFKAGFAFLVVVSAAHALPYLFLNWKHFSSGALPRTKKPRWLYFLFFIGSLLFISLIDNATLKIFIDTEKYFIFALESVALPPLIALFFIPLMALPSACHLVYDTYVWKRRYASSELKKIINFDEINSNL